MAGFFVGGWRTTECKPSVFITISCPVHHRFIVRSDTLDVTLAWYAISDQQPGSSCRPN